MSFCGPHAAGYGTKTQMIFIWCTFMLGPPGLSPIPFGLPLTHAVVRCFVKYPHYLCHMRRWILQLCGRGRDGAAEGKLSSAQEQIYLIYWINQEISVCTPRTVHLVNFTLGMCIVTDPGKCSATFGSIWTHDKFNINKHGMNRWLALCSTGGWDSSTYILLSITTTGPSRQH